MIRQAYTMKEASAITPTVTEKEKGTILPTLSKNEAAVIWQVPTQQVTSKITLTLTRWDTGITPEMPTDPTQKNTPKLGWLTLPSSDSRISDDNTQGEEYVSHILNLISLNLNCRKVMDNEMNLFAYFARMIGNKAKPVLQMAVTENPQFFPRAQALFQEVM